MFLITWELETIWIFWESCLLFRTKKGTKRMPISTSKCLSLCFRPHLTVQYMKIFWKPLQHYYLVFLNWSDMDWIMSCCILIQYFDKRKMHSTLFTGLGTGITTLLLLCIVSLPAWHWDHVEAGVPSVHREGGWPHTPPTTTIAMQCILHMMISQAVPSQCVSIRTKCAAYQWGNRNHALLTA